MTRIDALRALFRAAVFELTQRKDIPFKVVIREYVDARLYEDEVPGMVNGVSTPWRGNIPKAMRAAKG